MPLPVGLETVTVTATRLRPDGTAPAGTITFTPSPDALTSAGDEVLVGGPVTMTFTGDGAEETVVLLATDAPGVLPTGWTYTVAERWSDAPSRDYSILLPLATSPVDLSELAPTSPSAGTLPDMGAFAQTLMSAADAAAARTVLGLDEAGADAVDLRRLTDVAGADRAASVAGSQIDYADAASFVEQWADLSAWSSGTFAQVSGGRLYSANQGAGSAANHAFVVAEGESARVVATVVHPSIPPSGAVMIGVTSDAAGGAITAGGATLRGIYIGNPGIRSWDRSTAVDLNPVVTGKTYQVTITIDPDYISCVAMATDGTGAESRCKFARAGIAINNIAVFNSDSRQLTGMSVAPLGARKAIATVTPRTGIEGIARTTQWTAIAGNNVKVAVPPTYDSRKPSPVAMCFHGNGSDENVFTDNAIQKQINDALIGAGYIVVSTAYTPAVSTWGAQASLDAYYAAYKHVRDNYAIGPIVLLGNSMGGLESLLTLAERRIPGITAWVGTSPAADLAVAYANPTFTATINSAYGISGDYAAKTLGHDPMLKEGYAFRGVPMLFLAATDDTTVGKAANTDAMAAKVAPYSSNVVVQAGITGGHSFNIAPYVSQAVAFFDAHASG